MRHIEHLVLLAGLAVGASSVAVPAAGQERSAGVQLEQAMHVERVEGDLQRAISLFQRILSEHPSDRAVGAKAQLHIGICYETLGRTEAQRAYRRVIDQYADRPDEVAVARQRLAGLAHAVADRGRGPTFTRIEIASRPHSGALSPDGANLAFVSDGGVWVVPIHGHVDSNIAGAPRRIGSVHGVWDNAGLLAWSGDGRWIAVNGNADSADAVYVVPAAGGEPRVIHLPKRGSHAWSYRLSLSPNGSELAFSALREGQVAGQNETQKRVIYTVAVPDGTPRRLTDVWGRLPAFSPDGRTIAFVSDRQRQSGSWEGGLWLVPASGGQPVKLVGTDSGRIRGPVWSPRGDFIAAHYEPGLNNASKELWVVPVRASDPASSLIRIPLPNVSFDLLAGWTPDDRLGVFMDTPEDPGVVYTMPASGGMAVQVTPDSGRPWSLAWAPAGDRVYLVWRKDPGFVSRAVLGSIPADGGHVAAVPVAWGDSTVPGFGVSPSPDGRRLAFMAVQGMAAHPGRRPADEEVGLWTVGASGGEPRRLTSRPKFDAFPSWSPDGRSIAFLRMADGTHWNLYVIPAEGGEPRQLTTDADSVLAGKIAYSPDGRRIAFFSRTAIKAISSQGGHAETLAPAGDLDPFPSLAWYPDGERIVHTASTKILVERLADGTRTELATGLPAGLHYNFLALSPDGTRLAFNAWRPSETKFWLISDFLPRAP